MSSWVAVDGGQVKTHLCPSALLADLLADLRDRGAGELEPEPIESFGIDRGGFCFASRPVEKFDAGGTALSVPSEHVGHYLERLEGLEPRSFASGRSYYKLHCFWNCVVLEPATRELLLAQMRARAAEAEARADAFYRDIDGRP